MNTAVITVLALGLSASAAIGARAAPSDTAPAFPSRPIRIIVGFPPGSGTDILARFVGGKLSERVSQPVVVDNRPGAERNHRRRDHRKVACGRPHDSVHVDVSHDERRVYKLPFDAVKSFAPVAMLGEGALALVTHPSFRLRP
jgi:tripartite-type tricarboxylate transporter receptor subunit TctC